MQRKNILAIALAQALVLAVPADEFAVRSRAGMSITYELGPPAAAPVQSVVPASPAALAGIEEGDRIVGIEGQPLRFANRAQLSRFLVGREPGKPLWLTIERGGRVLEREVLPVAPTPIEASEMTAYLAFLEPCYASGRCTDPGNEASPAPAIRGASDSRILALLQAKPLGHATLWIQKRDDGSFEFRFDDQVLTGWRPEDDSLMRGKLERILEVLRKGERARWDFHMESRDRIRDGLVEPSVLEIGSRILAQGGSLLPAGDDRP